MLRNVEHMQVVGTVAKEHLISPKVLCGWGASADWLLALNALRLGAAAD